jgi:hypothetical protein
MGVSRPLVSIPDRLRGLVERDRRGGSRQPAVAVLAERWIPRLAADADVIAGFPDELDRDRVRELVLDGSPGAAGTLAGFIATQIWGYGTNGYGPARLAKALSDPRLPGALEAARSRLKSGDPVGAFRTLCVEHQIPWTGMAFGSKYLYFADPHRRALILDRIIRDWLAEHARVWLTGRRDEREYAVWLLLAERWAGALRLSPERLEMLIFNDGLGEISSWQPVEATSGRIGTISAGSVTCADAIARVLEGAVDGMRAADIARQINRDRLYRRQDGQPLPAYQVSSIAHANRKRFRIADGVITLHTSAAATSGSPSRARSPASVREPTTRNLAQEARSVILLGCVKQKLDHQAAAKDVYRSRLWKARRAYAEASGRRWLILSAKHGLLNPDVTIAPYDIELRKLSATERRRWGERTVHALQHRFGSLSGMTFEVHAGEAYRRAIERGVNELGAKLDVPLFGLPIGKQPAWYHTHEATPRLPVAAKSRRQLATSGDIKRALLALDHAPVRVAARDWPAELQHLDQPGMYSWWVDPTGANALSEGLGYQVATGRIYAGQTGATKWPSGKTGTMTLARRIGANHLRGQIRGSTFRLTLASVLRNPLGLVVVGPRRLDGASENRLSEWLRSHLRVAAHPFPAPDALADLEHRVLSVLDPPLNIDGMPSTPIRTALSSLRSTLSP